MSQRPTLVTKHCEARFWQGLIDGTILIGSLSNYRKIESTSGLLDDHDEGISGNNIRDPMVNFTGKMGPMNMINCTAIGCAVSVSVTHTIDANVFCLSKGPYSKSRHLGLLEGNGEGYLANPLCTAFVEYDLNRLEYAMNHLAKLRFGSVIPVISDAVTYTGRDRTIPLAAHQIAMSDDARRNHAVRSIFMKPQRFSCEEEYRLAFNVGSACQLLLTLNERNDVRRNFAAAIANPGAATLQ